MWHPNELFGQWQKHEYKYDDLGHIETQTASFSVFGGTLTYIWRKDLLIGIFYEVQFEWLNSDTRRVTRARARLDNNIVETASLEVCLMYLKKCAIAVIHSAVTQAFVDDGDN